MGKDGLEAVVPSDTPPGSPAALSTVNLKSMRAVEVLVRGKVYTRVCKGGGQQIKLKGVITARKCRGGVEIGRSRSEIKKRKKAKSSRMGQKLQ